MNEATIPAARVKGLLMFLYRGAGDKRYWVRVTNDGEDTDASAVNDGRVFPDDMRTYSFAWELVKSAEPGQIYEVEFSPDFTAVFHSINPKTKRPKPMVKPYAGRWRNLADVLRWKAIDSDYAGERAADDAARKDRAGGGELAVFGPVRDAYRRLPAPARAQLVARIVAFIAS